MFYRSLKTGGVAEKDNTCCKPIKRAASFLNSLKDIPQRACPSGLKTMVEIVRGEY